MIYHPCRAEFCFSKSLRVKRPRVVVWIYDFIKWQQLDTKVFVITENALTVCMKKLKRDNGPITSYFFRWVLPNHVYILKKSVWKSEMPSLTVGILKRHKAPIFSTSFIKTLGCVGGAKSDWQRLIYRVLCKHNHRWNQTLAWWRHQIKHFPHYWPFVRGIHRSPGNSLHKGKWRGALMFSLICTWTNSWASNRDVGDMRRHRGHYDVIVMVNCIKS